MKWIHKIVENIGMQPQELPKWCEREQIGEFLFMESLGVGYSLIDPIFNRNAIKQTSVCLW